MNKHITFYNYVIDDVNSKEYNPSLPFGGIRKDAPDKIKQQFDEFVKEYNTHINKLVSEGENENTARILVKKYYEWKKEQITKKCQNSWKEHFHNSKKSQ